MQNNKMHKQNERTDTKTFNVGKPQYGGKTHRISSSKIFY